ncbi:MAG: hypothetical protein Q4G60_15310 [bacterium]|nr:hypothetical protein [bacterium]
MQRVIFHMNGVENIFDCDEFKEIPQKADGPRVFLLEGVSKHTSEIYSDNSEDFYRIYEIEKVTGKIEVEEKSKGTLTVYIR